MTDKGRRRRDPGNDASAPTKQQGRDVTFLVERFGILEREAAGLVARNSAVAERLEDEAYERGRHEDATAGVPTPEESRRAHLPDSDEDALKPALGRRNNAAG